MIAEFDAISLYEQSAAMTENKKLKDALLNVAGEEKTTSESFKRYYLKKTQNK